MTGERTRIATLLPSLKFAFDQGDVVLMGLSARLEQGQQMLRGRCNASANLCKPTHALLLLFDQSLISCKIILGALKLVQMTATIVVELGHSCAPLADAGGS